MLRKIFVLMMTTALLLAACAQAASETPYRATVMPTQSSDDSPDKAVETADSYPNPAQAIAPAETDPAYPEPEENPARVDAVENLALEKGINTDFAPQESDLDLAVGPAYVEIEGSSIAMTEGDPSVVALHLSGNLPNPCYHLRVLVREPDKDGRLSIIVYSVTDPEKVCAEVLQPFEETISMDTVPTGKYSVYINDTELGQIEVK